MTALDQKPLQFSIVVATHNRRYLLPHTLPTLLRQHYPPSAYEVILVVDGSRDGTAEYARSRSAACALEILVQESRGPAVARNAGISAASGELVLFMDDDICCTPQVLQEHAAGHALGPIDLRVHGALAVAPESPLTLAAWITHQWYHRYDAELQLAISSDPNWSPYLNVNASVRTELLRELGGFDEAVPFPREDFELAYRMMQLGIAFQYRPRALAYEVFAKTSQAYVRDGTGFGAAEVYICRKHPRYRPQSLLAPLDRERPTPVRTVARRVIPRLPSSAERVLQPGVQAAELLIRRPRARVAGARLLELQHRIVFVRGAREIVGSPGGLKAEFDRWLPVLMYHRVADGTHGLHHQLTISPRAFESQIGWLARRGYTTIRPSDWLEWRAGRGKLPPKPVLITFDDAYAEIAEHALPALGRRGFGALVFVVTGQLGGVNSWDTFAPGFDSPALMSAAAVQDWARRGIDFGAHGRSHTDLLHLGAAELEDEIRGSRDDLERVLGCRVACFAYPFGSYNNAARELVSGTYDLAFTATDGLNGLRTDPHLLRRTAPTHGDRPLEFMCRVTLGKMPFARSRNIIRLRTRIRKLSRRS